MLPYTLNTSTISSPWLFEYPLEQGCLMGFQVLAFTR